MRQNEKALKILQPNSRVKLRSLDSGNHFILSVSSSAPPAPNKVERNKLKCRTLQQCCDMGLNIQASSHSI